MNSQDLAGMDLMSNIVVGLINANINLRDAFFQDLEDSVGPLVRNSLFLYVAYEIKAVEANAYKADPKAEVPFLKREAELRKVKVEDLANLVISRGTAFKAAIREMELLRIEFNIRYSNITDYQEKLTLRDELIGKIRSVMQPLQ